MLSSTLKGKKPFPRHKRATKGLEHVFFFQKFYLKSGNEYVKLKRWLFCFELKLICLFIRQINKLDKIRQTLNYIGEKPWIFNHPPILERSFYCLFTKHFWKAGKCKMKLTGSSELFLASCFCLLELRYWLSTTDSLGLEKLDTRSRIKHVDAPHP